MTDPSKSWVPTTPDVLHQEFVNNKWSERLAQYSKDRIDVIKAYDEGDREYRKRIISNHMENGVKIAVTITKEFFDGHATFTIKMLRIGGIPHIVP